MTVDTAVRRSRRALLAAAAGGLAGLAAGALGRPLPARGAAGGPLVMGAANTAGTTNTSLTTASSGTALLVTQTGSGTALRGSATGSNSIAGFFTAQNGTGISGVTGTPSNYGVFGQNNGAAGTGGAIRAAGGNNHGLVGTSDNADRNGVKGQAPGTGVYGEATSPVGQTAGVFGTAMSGTGSAGVLGLGSGAAHGLRGIAESGHGVFGLSTNGRGVDGESENNAGVYGNSVNGFAGYFQGPVHVTGLLTKGGGGFKVDHPLDPADRYLTHSFVESPDMKNVYDGLADLDDAGEATVELPAYFEALNRDLRYQLTAVGAAAPKLHVRTKVANGRFTIAGGTPGQQVCWQVTGIRQDAFAEAHRIVVDETKPAPDRGLYLHPELYGQPAEKGLGWRDRRTDVAPPI